MANAPEIIAEIDNYLDKYALKKSTLTPKDLIDYIEEKWYQANDEKYEIHQASIFIGRMINEYIKLNDYNNMKRWLDMMNLHPLSQKHPDYINNYYNGECCLECGNEEKALEYFHLCHKENPEYIFTRAPFCFEFFNKHLENPKELPDTEQDDNDYIDYNTIILKDWQLFFNEKEETIEYVILDDDSDEIEEHSVEHNNGIQYLQNNQTVILESILSDLLNKYPNLQEIYDYPQDEKEDFMPDISEIKDFADLLSPSTIYITSVFKDNNPYIGYMFSCSWDQEHGLGIMTYKNQVIEIGGADTAFSTWSAEEDLNKN
ncbi:hypothetical protein OIU80_13240 [Flavobacterium sp. LS1R47]|uniref:DUF6985 domain-containing protein n=1 Tax=Flavobacterium frigoritolerans TaxID=2987686 RepID=A0A9X2ZS64_9FLAO|nr:hypothetical protein [Flavobacterium frigoritolerans]MCV9933248.1 hypothetical protein [Flavobacterium frigoritolerans]